MIELDGFYIRMRAVDVHRVHSSLGMPLPPLFFERQTEYTAFALCFGHTFMRVEEVLTRTVQMLLVTRTIVNLCNLALSLLRTYSFSLKRRYLLPLECVADYKWFSMGA